MDWLKIRRRRFRNDETGSVTVEAVIWFPLFVVFLMMLADASMIFMNQARILRIVQDGTRRFATGSLVSCDALEAWLVSRIAPISPGVGAECDKAADFDSSMVYVSSVTMPSGELDLSGVTGTFANLTIRLESQHFMEK